MVDGRTIELTARGSDAYALDGVPQQAIDVIVDIGATRFCSVFGALLPGQVRHASFDQACAVRIARWGKNRLGSSHIGVLRLVG